MVEFAVSGSSLQVTLGHVRWPHDARQLDACYRQAAAGIGAASEGRGPKLSLSATLHYWEWNFQCTRPDRARSYAVTRNTCPGCTWSIAIRALSTRGNRSSRALLAAASTTTPIFHFVRSCRYSRFRSPVTSTEKPAAAAMLSKAPFFNPATTLVGPSERCVQPCAGQAAGATAHREEYARSLTAW